MSIETGIKRMAVAAVKWAVDDLKTHKPTHPAYHEAWAFLKGSTKEWEDSRALFFDLMGVEVPLRKIESFLSTVSEPVDRYGTVRLT